MAEDISKMCLLCRSNTDVDGISLLDPSKKITMEEISVLFNLKICSNNGLPTKICSQCYNRVIDFMALQYVCSMSYDYFCDYLKRFQSNDEQFENMTTNTTQTSINEQENSDHQISQPESTTTSEVNIESFQILEGTSIKICKISSHSDVSGTLINDNSGTLNDKYGTLNCKSETLISDKSALAEPNKTSNSSPVASKPSDTCKNKHTQVVSPPELKELQIIVNQNEVKKYLEKQQETPNIKIKKESDIDENDYKVKFAAVQQIYVHDSQDHHEELESVKSEENSPLNDNAEGVLELKPTIRVEEMDWTFLDDSGTISISAVDFAFIKSEISTIQPIPVEQCEDHPSDKSFSCHLCEKKYKGLLHFKHHLTRTHQLSKEQVLKYVPEFYQCKYCHGQFKNPSRLHEHEGCHTLPFKCDVCDKRYGYKSHLTLHKLTHSDPQRTCPHCDKKFRRTDKLKFHIERLHSGGIRKYKCDQCEWKFKIKRDLIRHVKFVHARPASKISWKCAECGKCFKFKHYLSSHKRHVHIEAKYTCDHCDKKFKLKIYLKQHIERHHSGGVCNYKCNQCEKKFKWKQYLLTHIRCVHAPTSKKSWKCAKCGKCFKCEGYLKKHIIQVHAEAKYCCSHCDKIFKQKGSLKVHIERHHIVGVRNYKCNQCEKKFKCKQNLSQHITSFHAPTSKLSWKCAKCGKCFKCEPYLKKHIFRFHAEANYCCAHCVKKFKRKDYLKVHIEIQHIVGICKYKCDQCKEKFKCRSYLYRHIKLAHSATNK